MNNLRFNLMLIIICIVGFSSSVRAGGATIVNPPAAIPGPTEPKPLRQCTICFDEKNTCTLACTHEFCTDCLNGILDGALQAHSTATLRCPNLECKKELKSDDFKKITPDRKKLDALDNIQMQEWIAKQPNAKHCLTPNCRYVFINETKNTQTMKCPQCNHEYCSNCLYPHARNITCQQAEESRKTDKANDDWKKQNTKRCPQCNVNIEKHTGCDYMKCSQCKHGFCWTCLGPHDHNMGAHIHRQINHVNEQAAQELAARQRAEQEQAAALARQRAAEARAAAIARRLEEQKAAQEQAARQRAEHQAARERAAQLARQQAAREQAAREAQQARLRAEQEQKDALLAKQRAEQKVAQELAAKQQACELSRAVLHRAILDDSAPRVKQAVQIWLDANLKINDLHYLGHGIDKPLPFAVKLARPAAVQALIECGFNKDDFLKVEGYQYGMRLVAYAAQQGDIKTALILVRNGAQWIDEGRNLITLTLNVIDQAPELCLEFLQELFTRGLNAHRITWRDHYESNMWSLVLDRPEFNALQAVMALYVRNGGNPNQLVTNKRFFTPLFMAITQNSTEGVRCLININADVNQKTYNPANGNVMITPLAYARKNGAKPEIIRLLEGRGARLQ